jgi:hypothetical protein
MTLITNIKELFTPDWNHFIFVNAGTFIAAMFLPMRTKIELGTKVILLLFFCGQMFAGALHEYRIMLESLPISILYLRQSLWNSKPRISQTKNQVKPVSAK